MLRHVEEENKARVKKKKMNILQLTSRENRQKTEKNLNFNSDLLSLLPMETRNRT